MAISNHRLISFDDDQVTFRWRDYAHGNKKRKMTVSAEEFIRRFLLHVLPKGFVRIRHFGFMANYQRTESLDLCRKLLAMPPVDRSIEIASTPSTRFMPALRRSYDHRRAVEPSADSMEISFKMFSRYLVAALHNGNLDVRSHVHAEVCSTTRIALKSTLDLIACAFLSHSRSTEIILSTPARSSCQLHSVQNETRIPHHSP